MTRVKKLGLFPLGVVLLVLAAGSGLWFYARHRYLVQPASGRAYVIHYAWDGGIKSLQIADANTGMEERDPIWRRRAAREAREVLPGLVKTSGLTRAVGRFYVSFLGNEEPYLPRFAASTEDPDLVRDPDVTPLMSALYRGETVKARELIAAGGNVNSADQHGETALMLAAARGDAGAVQSLLAAGADVSARNKDGETALFPAAFLDRLAAAADLVRDGADVNATSNQGITPLMEAAQHSLRLVRFLVASGANVNARNVHGGTALMTAAGGGHEDVVRALLELGADVNAKDNDGRTPLSSALVGGHSEVARLLKQTGARE